MKKSKLLLLVVASGFMLGGAVLLAADHIDSPAVTNQSTDITDLYVFRGQNPQNLVFVANTQGLMAPSATGAAKFDQNTLIEFNIDNNGDYVEDLVIQCELDGNKMRVHGPIQPSMTGSSSRIEGGVTAEVNVTSYGSTAQIGTGVGGIKVFAGPRDDPFFFDLNQFKKILAGTDGGFKNPGSDTFAGTNVLSVVVEVPKTALGSTGTLNVWLETKTKK